MVGKLEMDVGGMFAEKSTNLIRKGSRKIRAGKKVIFLKPAMDNRYSHETVMTHSGIEHEAINVGILDDLLDESFIQTAIESDVVCIDEIQFFPKRMVYIIDALIYRGIDVYCAGLDLDRFGKPFGIVPELLAKAEVITKHHAVCGFCGNDAWVSVGNDSLKNNSLVNVGNDYTPACRTCAYVHGGIR